MRLFILISLALLSACGNAERERSDDQPVRVPEIY